MHYSSCLMETFFFLPLSPMFPFLSFRQRSTNIPWNISPSWHFPLYNSHSCWNSCVTYLPSPLVRSSRRVRAVSLALPLRLSGSRCSVITIWIQVNWISTCFFSVFKIKMAMCLKQLICNYLLYLYDNCGENVGRVNSENRNTRKKEHRGEKACSVGDLRIFIYFFFPGHNVKYLLRKAFFFREWKTYCVCG